MSAPAPTSSSFPDRAPAPGSSKPTPALKGLQALGALWGTAVLRGLAYLLVGALLAFGQGDDPRWFTWVLGAAFLLVAGLVLVDAALTRSTDIASWGRWALGAIILALAVLVVTAGRQNAQVLGTVLGLGVAVGGIFTVGSALWTRTRIGPGWAWAFAEGMVGILFGVVLVARTYGAYPFHNDFRFLFAMTGLYLILAGTLVLTGAIDTRAAARRAAGLAEEPATGSPAPSDSPQDPASPQDDGPQQR